MRFLTHRNIYVKKKLGKCENTCPSDGALSACVASLEQSLDRLVILHFHALE